MPTTTQPTGTAPAETRPVFKPAIYRGGPALPVSIMLVLVTFLGLLALSVVGTGPVTIELAPAPLTAEVTA